MSYEHNFQHLIEIAQYTAIHKQNKLHMLSSRVARSFMEECLMPKIQNGRRPEDRSANYGSPPSQVSEKWNRQNIWGLDDLL